MSVQKFLDEVGLSHTWSKIKNLLNGKADTNLNNVTNDNFRDKAIDAGVGGLQVVTATSTDGVTYTATVTGVTALTAGLTIVIIPNVVSASISAKLNVNGLGDKYIRQSTTNNTTTGLTPKNANWMAANKPITIQYDGTQWKTIAARSNASDMNGTVAIANGGTGATAAADARTNLGLSTAVTAASISGKVITLTFADGTTKTLTTQDTNSNFMPNYSAGISLPFTAGVEQSYTAPSNGFIIGSLDNSNINTKVYVNNVRIINIQPYGGTVFLPVVKGDVVKYKTENGGVNENIITFFPAKGV